jgi:nucleotide-binding universal stress UspA family protein
MLWRVRWIGYARRMVPTPAHLRELAPVIRHVVHPSDFSEASRRAFAYALKTAVIAKGRLSLIDETDDQQRDWSDFPGVRETLARWGILPAGRPAEALEHLGIDVAKIIETGSDPVAGVLDYLEQHGADLIVLATQQKGFDWLRKSVAEPVARKSGEMTLFVPATGRSFVSEEDGSVSLRRILISVAETPSSYPAILATARLVRQLKIEQGHVTLLHVGEKELVVKTPRVAGWGWRQVRKSGNVVDVILETAQKEEMDLIVMSTDGRNGFLDALRGSHSERVLRQAPCPLLAIPESSTGATKMTEAEKKDWYQEREKPARRRPTVR